MGEAVGISVWNACVCGGGGDTVTAEVYWKLIYDSVSGEVENLQCHLLS